MRNIYPKRAVSASHIDECDAKNNSNLISRRSLNPCGKIMLDALSFNKTMTVHIIKQADNTGVPPRYVTTIAQELKEMDE